MVWRGGQGGRGGTPRAQTPESYKALTLGLEKDLFTVDQPDSAANFHAVKKKIAQWVGTSNWKGAARASQVIETLVEPVFVKLDPPVSPVLADASAPNAT